MRVGKSCKELARCGLVEMNPLALVKTEEKAILYVKRSKDIECSLMQFAVVAAKLDVMVG